MNKDTIKIEIGKRLTKIRENMHMNKKDFAELIGLKQQYLGTVENGKKGLTIEKTIEICEKTGISADYLLLGKENSLKEQLKENFSNYTTNDIENAFEVVKNAITLFK